MSQKVLASLLLLVLVLVILALLLSVYAFGGGCCSPDSTAGVGKWPDTLLLVAVAMLSIGLILDLIAWIGALAITAKQHKWGWFIFILLFNWLAILIYLKMEEDASVPQSLLEGPQNALNDHPE